MGPYGHFYHNLSAVRTLCLVNSMDLSSWHKILPECVLLVFRCTFIKTQVGRSTAPSNRHQPVRISMCDGTSLTGPCRNLELRSCVLPFRSTTWDRLHSRHLQGKINARFLDSSHSMVVVGKTNLYICHCTQIEKSGLCFKLCTVQFQ